MSWNCYEKKCKNKEHPDKWVACPYTGVDRDTANTPGPDDIPRSWHDNPAGWYKLKDQLERLDEDELRLSGLQRVQEEKVVVELFVVRLFDGMDGQWMDVSDPVTEEEAQRIWNENTKNGTAKISFDDIDYYRVFPASTSMLYANGFGERP